MRSAMAWSAVHMGGVDEGLEAQTVRCADLRPRRDALVDTRSPGPAVKENLTPIGPVVWESPAQHVDSGEPRGFDTGGGRRPIPQGARRACRSADGVAGIALCGDLRQNLAQAA